MTKDNTTTFVRVRLRDELQWTWDEMHAEQIGIRNGCFWPKAVYHLNGSYRPKAEVQYATKLSFDVAPSVAEPAFCNNLLGA
jgi:hypothetical protein